MTPDDLDRILTSEDSIEPSSGFSARVMVAIHRQADEPPPLKFPWTRFAVGVSAACGMAVAGAALLDETSSEMVAQLPVSAAELASALTVLLVIAGLAAVPKLLFRP